jgi:hypothetical protein
VGQEAYRNQTAGGENAEVETLRTPYVIALAINLAIERTELTCLPPAHFCFCETACSAKTSGAEQSAS